MARSTVRALQSGALGESLAYVANESYASVRNALLAQNAPGADTLPVSAPANAAANLLTTQAEAKALGLAANSRGVDGYVGFDAAANIFSYSTTAAPPSSQYDFVAAVEHEFSEVMGRISGVDQSTPHAHGSLPVFGTECAPTIVQRRCLFLDHRRRDQSRQLEHVPDGGSRRLGGERRKRRFRRVRESRRVYDALTATDLTLMNALGWASAPALQMTLASDVFWLNGDGTLAAWTVSGQQQVTYQGSPATPDASWSVAGIGDFNGDGKADVLWHNTSGELVDWSMNGSQVTASQPLTLQGQIAAPDASWSIAGIGDFNGDGKSDILWRGANGALIDWTMNGSQITASQSLSMQGVQVSPDASWSIAGVGDFNGDGKSDILWRDASGTLVDWTMNGSQIASSQTVSLGGSAVTPDASWNIVGIGDFNGDGKSDILWRDTSGTLIDWTMNGSQIASIQEVTLQGSPATPDASWQIAQIGDFNANGKSDILWRNSDGALAEWTMNGAQIAATQETGLQTSAGASAWTTLAKPTDFA